MVKPARIHVRFSDLDVLGHVNNNIYSNYFEIARVHYLGQVLGRNWDWTEFTVVLVRNVVEFVKPVFLTDEPQVTLRVEKIGNKSFSLSYVLTVNGEVHTTGESTLVAFNGKSQTSMEIHPVMRKALESLKKEQ